MWLARSLAAEDRLAESVLRHGGAHCFRKAGRGSLGSGEGATAQGLVGIGGGGRSVLGSWPTGRKSSWVSCLMSVSALPG